MASVLRPKGPLPARVYWMRRLVAVGVLALVVLVVAALISLAGKGGKDGSGGAQPAAGASVESSQPAPAKTSNKPGTSGKPAPGKKTPAQPAPAPTTPAQPTPLIPGSNVPTCGPTDLTLSFAVNGVEFTAGNEPVFTIKVENRGEPCLVEIGDHTRQLEIVSGNAPIWSTDQCKTGKARLLLLGTGKNDSSKVVWNRARASSGCGAANTARPGTYRATVRVNGLSSNEAVFVLR